MKKSFNLKSLALIAIFSVVSIFALSAFTKAKTEKQQERVTQFWYYTPNTPPGTGDLYDHTKYTDIVPANCDGISTVPCEISFVETELYDTLEEYLDYLETNTMPVPINNNKDL